MLSGKRCSISLTLVDRRTGHLPAVSFVLWQGAVDHSDQLQSAAEILCGLSFALQPLNGALPGAVLGTHDFYNEGRLGH